MDVWAGAYHNFIKVNYKYKEQAYTKYMSWGLNQYSQLGLGYISEGQIVP